jgi:hypothetical protein
MVEQAFSFNRTVRAFLDKVCDERAAAEAARADLRRALGFPATAAR